jgi:cytochrome P450
MTTEPVKDWTKDYDIFAEEYVKDPYEIWDDLRGRCPVAHTERWGGSWMPTRYEDVFKIAQDFEHFSSTQPLVAPVTPPENIQRAEGEPDFSGVRAPPISSDPPEHTWSRRLLLPPFSVKSIAKWEPMTREHCQSLIDGFIEDGRVDAAAGYAQQIPPYVIASMLGVPRNMTDTFTNWVRDLLEYGLTNPELRIPARRALLAFLWDQIQLRKKNPTDDLMTELLNSEVDGRPVPEIHVLGTCVLLVIAGIDTTWSSIGSALWHLAQHPEDRRRMIEEPDIFNRGVEELLRAYSPVTMARVMTDDFQYDGHAMRQGERVLMNFPAANRDPEKFNDADKVIIDRAENPHIAFGVGIHRCAGSNLARMEMRAALQEWLSRIPEFRLEDPGAVTWAGGQVRGPRSMMVVFE